MTFHVERIDHVVLRVRDLPGMVRFYEQALGFKVERTLERINLVQMRAGASMLDLVQGERPQNGGNMDHLCFRIEPFDRAAIEHAAFAARHCVGRNRPALRRGRQRAVGLFQRSRGQSNRIEGAVDARSRHRRDALHSMC